MFWTILQVINSAISMLASDVPHRWFHSTFALSESIMQEYTGSHPRPAKQKT
jgi:hypothetical protein